MVRQACYEASGTVLLPDDPVARSTGWTPLVPGGASFRTRRLTTPSPERFEFRRGVRRACGADSPDCVPFVRIHALQIVAEHCSGSKGGSFISYELNLVLKDGSRRNVVDHGNLKKLRTDAAALCERLKLPLWDNGDAPCRRTGWKKVPSADQTKS